MTALKGRGEDHVYDGSQLRIAIVHARWNHAVVSALVQGARKSLLEAGVNPKLIYTEDVPGSFELPWSIRALAKQAQCRDQKFDAIIAIGVLIKGETMHFEYIADATSQALMNMQSEIDTPVIFGLLTVLTEQQALARAGLTPEGHCHGEDWGKAAVELGIKHRRWLQNEFT